MSPMENTQPEVLSPESMDVAVGRRVHQLMWEQKLTQTALGAIIGTNQSTVGKKLRGDRKWTLDEVQIAADVLNTTVAYLFGETANRAPEGPTLDYGSDGSPAQIIDLDAFRNERTPPKRAEA